MTDQNSIIIGGVKYPCKSKVITWETHGLTFKPGQGARVRNTKKTKIDLFVVHYTAGEGNYKSLFNVLNNRELGVEFYISKDGTIYQFADPVTVDTFDAGTVNPRSVGVEVQCYGFVAPGKRIPEAGKDRPTYPCTIRGKTIPAMADFMPAQHEALFNLIETVRMGIPTIPWQTPGNANGTACMARTFTHNELAEFSGVLGHMSLSSRKFDPGHSPMNKLIARGCKVVPYKD